MKKIFQLLIAFIGTSSLSAQSILETGFPAAAGEGATPCMRTVASDLSLKNIGGAFDGVFTSQEYGGGPELHDGPLLVEYMTINFEVESVEAFHNAFGTSSIDYVFRGTVTEDSKKNLGAAKVELVDMARGIVVRSQEGTWPIVAGQKAEGTNAIREIAKSFMPLDEVLYNYEKIPLSCEVELPGDEVGSGEKVTISIKKLRFQGELPKPWQYLAVKVEKGKILNGVKLEDYYYFQVGQGGFVEVEYESPEECKEQNETMTIYNTCIFLWAGDRRSGSGFTNDEIGRKEFPVVCYDGELVFETDMECDMPNVGVINIHNEGRIPFKYSGANEIEGNGPAHFVTTNQTPQLPLTDEMDQVINYHFKGTIRKNNNGMRILYFNADMIKYTVKKKSMVPGFKCVVRQAVYFDGNQKPPRYENCLMCKGEAQIVMYGCWSVNSNGHVETYEFFNEKENGDLAPMTMQPAIQPGILVICGDDGCMNFNIGGLKDSNANQASQMKGEIPWKDGAEIVTTSSQSFCRQESKIKLVLYKK